MNNNGWDTLSKIIDIGSRWALALAFLYFGVRTVVVLVTGH